MSNLSVCHVVNRFRDTSMQGDLAKAQTRLNEFEKVGILGWYDIESSRDMGVVETHSINIPDTYRINRSQYNKTKQIFSKYDIIHTHQPHSGFYSKLIAKRLGKPVIHTEHNNHGGFSQKGRVANGVTNVLADAVVCVSESVRESLFRWEDTILRDGKISVINNGVDIEQLEEARKLEWSIHDIAEIDPEAILVGSAGMLTEQKAHDVLIEAVDRANAESEQPIELVISGDGELRGQLRAQIKNAEYSERIHLLGFLEKREQVYKMMDEIDIYAMPSRWEGFCVAALEAMAIGNACVFSDIDEFHRPFQEAAKFHKKDDQRSLATCLIELSTDSESRELYEQKGKLLVKNEYTLTNTAEKYVKKYYSIQKNYNSGQEA